MPAVVMVGIMAVGTIISAVGMYAQSRAAAKAQEDQADIAMAQARHSATVANYNADRDEENAAQVRKKGEYDVELQKEKLRRLLGTQRLAFASSGVELSSGSPLEVMLQQTRDSELDIEATRYNTELEAKEYERKAWMGRYSALNTLKTGVATQDAGYSQAGATRTAGTIAAAGTILQGAGKAYGAFSTPTKTV
jgi:hypothetical protein